MTDDTVYAGIDIGGTNVKFGLFDSGGKVLYREQRRTLAEKGAIPLMHLITNISEQLLYYAVEEEYSVSWLGVGTPGAVDFKTGTVIGPCPNIDGWHGMDIGKRLKERLNMPVFVDNDANCVALAEARFGAAIGAGSVVCVTVGTGIGGGIIINNRVWRGANYSAAEIGHMPINFDGPMCSCGAQGCIEAYCASSAILNRVRLRLKKELTPVFDDVLGGDLDNLSIRKLFAAQKKGDTIAREVLDETAEYLGIGLAGIVNLLNPMVVVIGGGVADGGGGFVEAVAKVIRKRAFKSAVENLNVVKASLGNDAGFIGAGLLGEINV
ncbi:MAG: ROK family protein [candidate division Zixibacteria bacterium]|nr:ROK family protein [candidate division Zixibacteria bacterium]